MIDYSKFFDQKNFVACISLRDKNYAIKENRDEFISKLELEHSIFKFPEQTHSNNVKIVNESNIYVDTDGVISTSSKFGLGILIADCAPIFLYNVNTNHFGLIHSGWRGSANKITSIALNKLIEKGSNPSDVKAVIGPSIGKCCFEIGKEVSELFDTRYIEPEVGSKFRLDLKALLQNQLISNGLMEKNLMIDSRCTFCEKNKFFSYRRDGQSAGRMLAIMGWKNK